MDMVATLVMLHKPFKLTFIQWRLHMEFGFNRPRVSNEKKFEHVETEDLGRRSLKTSTFDIHEASCTDFDDCIYQL